MKPDKKDSRNLQKTAFENSKNVIYLTNENLSILKHILKDMLADFIIVFEKYSIDYTLGGGSVLGAVRHNGFIPWDDDIDLNLTRKDFNKLMEVFEKELGDKYYLCCPELSKGYGLAQAQIKKKGTLYQSFNELDMEQEKCGIGIDIFVMENTYNSSLLRKLHGFLCLGTGYALTCRKTYNGMKYIKNYISKDEKLFHKKAKIGRLLSWLSLDYLTKKTVKTYSLCKNNNSTYITIPTGRKHYFGELGKREDMCSTIKHKFEDLEVNIPKNYNDYLTRLYGSNYMEIPPEGEHEKHPLMKIDFGGNNQ